MADSAEAVQIWRNGRIPVVYRPGRKQSLLVRLPSAQMDYRDLDWLCDGRRSYLIEWQEKWKAWMVPQSRFNRVIRLALDRFERCFVIQEFRDFEQCAPACWNAEGFDCECSCLGANHGSGRVLAHVVSETFAFEWGERRLACRLIKKPRGLQL